MRIVRKYHRKIRKYAKRNPARCAGYVSTLTMILNNQLHFKSTSLLMFFIVLFIGLGESAQRAEDKKSIAAIYIKNHPTTPDSNLLDQIVEMSEKKKN